MKKKMLQRSLALGALMAFAITGSAMANVIGTVTIDGIETSVNKIEGEFSIGENSTLVDISTVKPKGNALSLTNYNDAATINGKSITISSETGRGLQLAYGAKLNLGNDKTEKISIITGGDMPVFSYLAGTAINITAKEFVVDATNNDKGVCVQSTTQYENAPANAALISVKADNIIINGKRAGISAFSNGQMNIEGNIIINATYAIDVRGNSTVNINKNGAYKTVLNGDILFETPNTPANHHNSGNLINAYVDIGLYGEESAWTGKAFQYYQDGNSVELEVEPYYGNVTGFKMTIADGASWNMTGDSFINDLTLQDGGVVNVQEGVEKFNAEKLNLNDGVVNLQGNTEQVATISNLTGEGGTVSVASDKAKMVITKSNTIDSLTATATQEYTEQLASDDMAEAAQTVANQITDSTATTDTKTAATDVYLPETDVTGVYTADVIDGYVTNGKEAVNSSNAGISNMGAIALMTWRQENNDMNKRLGELRDSNGEHGVWVRMTRGEGKYKSIKNQYNSYQIGYDEKLSVNKNWTVGAALTYTDGESSFAQGNGENTHKGLALYGSYLNDDGSFIDLIAKYSRLEHDFETIGGAGKGDYETNGYSLSAEYGKRFTKDNGLWIEPQVELTYGKVGSADYMTSKGVKVRQDGMDSLVGRLGFALGKDLAKDKGNVYLRASYLYDFDGETDMRFSKGGVSRTMEQDLGGGWWEVGVGANVNLSEASHLYFDVEKTYGGDVATPWQWNAGVRWSF